MQTTTDDSEGEVVNVSNKIPNVDEINKIINLFLGYIDQVPPKASAIKVNGKRAYAILRTKKNFSLNSKKVYLKSIFHLNSNNNTSNFSIECGKGFYVRSLARDIAHQLMTFGHVIESLCGYGTWLHGEAVSIGMVAVGELSLQIKLILLRLILN